MDYRPLGRTGFDVSILGYAAAPLGALAGTSEQAEARASIRQALELGINFFDVSPCCGRTHAETLLGEALRGVPRDRYILASKVGRYGTHAEECDYTASRTLRSVDGSLDRLGVEQLDLIQVHDIEFADVQQVIDETLPALERVREQGKARFIGVTGLPLQELELVSERAPIDTLLAHDHYALHDTSLLSLLPGLIRRGIGVINGSPLGMGLLSAAGPPQWHPASERVKQYCVRAAERAENYGSNIARLALQFATSHPQIPTTLMTMAHPQQVRRCAGWVQEPIDEELLAQIQDVLAPIHNVPWSQGRPENNPPEALR